MHYKSFISSKFTATDLVADCARVASIIILFVHKTVLS